MAIDFKTATDELLATFTHEELAKGLDSSVPSVRQARLAPSASAFRSPPQDWQRAVAKLASLRIERLQRLLKKLQ